ncbi:nucleolar pre-ribosomal-associated protein 1-like [Diadema antillarum]|uniref:nucleolar pre-ribosomal-associated protein 1-like n=1 Tax=Diadema antillarum TaxID=105358 RepID=UPI003A85499D
MVLHGKHVRKRRLAKKRKYQVVAKNDEEENQNSAESSVGKKRKTPFDPSDFIIQLKKDGISLAEVLGDFWAYTREFAQGQGDTDAVQEYLQHSPQCTEIIDLLNTDKRPNAELQLIFNCLTSIILRLAEDLHHYRTQLLGPLQLLLRTHMRHVQRALNPSQSAKVVMSALRLLTALVALDVAAAQEVLNVFRFDHGALTPLYNRSNSKAEEDVRICLMRFGLAFLITGDNHIIGQFLSHKDFLKNFFKGLVEDRASTLQAFLGTLLEHVVRNPAVTKTQKLALLNEYTLGQVATLYKNWRGNYDIQDNTVENAENPSEAGKQAVVNVAHNFLLEVTTSTKHGITFLDKSMGLGGRNQNSALYKFLLTLKTATTDDLVCDLVVNILKTCPDLLNKYLTTCPFTFAPRPSTTWLANVKLIEKIYAAQPHVSPALTRPERVGVAKLVSMVMVATAPATANPSFLQQCIKHQSSVICLVGLEIVNQMMVRARCNLDYVESDGSWLSVNEKRQFAKQYQDVLSRLLPDVDTFLACWERYLARMRGVAKQQNKENHHTEEEEPKDSQGSEQAAGLPIPKPSSILVLILKILGAHARILPATLLQTSFDFSRLLHGIFHRDRPEPGETAGAGGPSGASQHALLQFETMNFLFGFDVGHFRWFKEVKGEGSSMGQLLNVLMTSGDPKLQNVSKQLICKVLRHTGQFDQCPEEPSIWLDALSATSATSDPIPAAAFLQRSLTKVVRNPYPFNDRIMEAVAETETEREGAEGEMEETTSVSEAGIQAILDMEDIPPLTGSERGDDCDADQSESPVRGHDPGQAGSLPCSALLPAALEEFYATKEMQKVSDYLSCVIESIIHTQHNPSPICLLVRHASQARAETPKPELTDWMHLLSYCNLWLPGTKQMKVAKEARKTPPATEQPLSLSSLVRESFVMRSKVKTSAKMKGIKERLPLTPRAEILPTVRQCLLYMQTCFDQECDSSSVSFYIDVLLAVLHQATTISAEMDISLNSAVDTEDREENKVGGGPREASESEVPSEASDMKSEDIDWQSLSQVILHHPFVYKLQSDTLCSRLGEVVKVFEKFMPHRALEEMLRPLLETAEVNLNTNLIPVARDKQRLHRVTNLVESLLRFLPAKNCSNILKEVVHHLYSTATSRDSQTCSLLNLTSHLISRTLIIETMESKKDTVLSRRTLGSGHCSAPSVETLESDILCKADISNIVDIAVQAKWGALFDAIGRLFHRHPRLVEAGDVKSLMTACLSTDLDQQQKMGTTLLPILVNSNPCQFEECITDRLKQAKKETDLELLQPAVEAYLSRPREDTKKSTKCKKLLHKVYWKILSEKVLEDTPPDADSVMDGDEPCDAPCDEPHDKPVGTAPRVLTLLLPGASLADTTDLFNGLVKIPDSSPFTGPQLEVLTAVTSQLLDIDPDQRDDFQHRALSACLQSLVPLLKSSTQEEEEEDRLLVQMEQVGGLVELMKDFRAMPALSSTWKKFVTSGLKARYQNASFLTLLANLIRLVYSASHLDANLLPLSKLYQAVAGHSLFLPTMLPSDQETRDSLSAVKNALVRLLVTMSQREPSCCNRVHFTVLLGAYSATRTEIDRGLLTLMHIYEKNNASMSEYRPYIWGSEAVSQYSARKALGRTLWKQPGVKDVLKLLDPKLLLDSMLRFPLDQPLQPDVKEGAASESLENAALYDPSFLLPLFSHLLSPENLVPCEMFVECNALGFTLASLSSCHGDIRRAGYHTLSSFCHHLEGARFRGRREIAYVLEILKNSVTTTNQLLPSILTLFVAKAIRLMLQPESALYPIVISYLMLKPHLNTVVVPLFPRLFVGSGMQHKEEKTWMLQLLTDGLRSPADFRMCEKVGVFHTLLAFYASPLCEKAIGELILGVILKACDIADGATYLINQSSTLVWLHARHQTSGWESMDKIIGAMEKSLTNQEAGKKLKAEGVRALQSLRSFQLALQS